MYRVWYGLLAICLVVTIIFVSQLLKTEQIANAPVAKHGVLALQHTSLSDTEVVSLNGEWMIDGTRYIRVPSTWDVQNHPVFHFGYGTYELEIQLSEKHVGETLGLYIPNVATAYEVWIDGKKQLSNGAIGQLKSEMVPANFARTVYFVTESSTVDLRMKVANFSQRKGGLWDEIYLGTADAISLQSEKNKAAQLIVVGALLMMSIYFMLIYFLRKSQKSVFYLGLLTLVIAVRTLFTGDTFFIRLFPSFPWELQVKLEYATMIVGVPLFTRYIHHLYPEDRWPKLQTGVDIVSLIFLLLVMVTPALIYTQFLVVYQLIVIPLVAYFAYIFTKAMIRKGKTAYFNFICMLIFMIASLNDALFYLNLINTGQFAGIGFFIFLVSQTFVHALKYSEAFRHVENLSHELSEANQSLEHKVEERTKELKQLNVRLQNVEYSRKAMFSDIAHELSGPMTLIQGYAEAVIDRKVTSEDKYWQLIYEKADLLKRLIHDLAHLSELESRKVSITFQPIPAAQLPKQIYAHFQRELAARGHELHWHSAGDWAKDLPASGVIFIDHDRINQVVMNVIYNAVNYSGEGKMIAIAAKWRSAQPSLVADGKNVRIGELILRVTDNGPGIDEQDLPHIFKRLYRGERTKKIADGSRGLGLAIAKEIMDIHEGTIWVESDIGQGSSFYIALPVYIASQEAGSFGKL